MKPYITKTFEIPTLKGISTKNIEEHLKLYAGYVKNTNLVIETIEKLSQSPNINDAGTMYAINEINRRFGFEYNGMRNHEIFFASLQGGASPLSPKSKLNEAIIEGWGSYDAWLTEFKSFAFTRGIGWSMLYFDPEDKHLLNAWVDEHHLGQLNGCQLILALDMWEHAFVMDYLPSGKKNYIEDFFQNLNWQEIEKNFMMMAK